MRSPGRQNRFANSFSVSFPDFPSITKPPRSIRVHQEVGKHDVVELTYPVIPAFFSSALSTGVPVKITYRNDKVGTTFLGYVAHVKPVTVQALKRGVVITCVAASYKMKQHDSKVWKNRTASEIVVDIAKKHKLKPVVTQSGVRFSQQSLTGKSYWEKVTELASKVGYVTQVIGTELHFHPLDKMLDQFMTSIPLMLFVNDYTSPYSRSDAATLDMFQPKIGDYIESLPFKRTEKVISSVDPITGKAFTVSSSPNKVGKKMRSKTKDPLFSEISTHTVVGSKEMARALAEGQANLSRFSIPAEGAGQGDPRVAPYRTIEVKGTQSDSDGFWVVTKAEHFIHIDGRYMVEFSCVSDGRGEPTAQAVMATQSSGSLVSQISMPGIGKVTARSSDSGRIPVRNLRNDITVGMSGSMATSQGRLSSTTAMVKESENGFSVAPRQWVGEVWPNGQSCCPSV